MGGGHQRGHRAGRATKIRHKAGRATKAGTGLSPPGDAGTALPSPSLCSQLPYWDPQGALPVPAGSLG